MGQQDVKKVLKKEGNWLISNEIAKKAGYSLKSIQSSLRRLVKWACGKTASLKSYRR